MGQQRRIRELRDGETFVCFALSDGSNPSQKIAFRRCLQSLRLFYADQSRTVIVPLEGVPGLPAQAICMRDEQHERG
jgi:hypothetical protein